MHGLPPDDAAAAVPGTGPWRQIVAVASKPLLVFIAVGIIAAIHRFDHLASPGERVFDEID